MVRGKKPRTIMEEEDIVTFTEPKLPEDLVFTEILSKLPAKSLMRFKCVSKSWSTRISGDSSFIATHLNRHSDTDKQLSIVLGSYEGNVQGQDGFTIPRQRVSLLSDQCSKATEIDTSYIAGDILIVGSCNGLVCLQVLKPGESIHRVALWNPATRQLRYVAERQTEEPSVIFFGFGFDDESKDYKIVKLVASGVRVGNKSPLNGLVVRAQVFAKSSGGWRGGEDEEEGGGGVSGLIGFPFSSAVSANGALHWVAYKRGETRKYCILSFSLRDEVLRVADAPAVVGVRCRGFKLCKWKGSLAALEYVSESESRMWMATSGDNDSKKQSLCWRKAFEVDPSVRPVLLLGVWRDQFVVMRHCRRGFKLSLQDQLGHVRKLKGVEPGCFLYGAHDYVESLVSVL